MSALPRASAPKTPYCVPLFGGAGVIGCGDDEPEPVVLGGVTVREAVVAGGEPLFAVLLLLFQPAKIRKPTSSSSETPATQLHMPPTFSSRLLVQSSRRIIGSLKRGIRKTGISHGILHSSGRFVSSQHEENPLAVRAVPKFRPVPLDESSSILKTGPLRAC